MLHKDKTDKILKAFYKVYKTLGVTTQVQI